MKKVFIAVLLIPVILYGGIKGALWFSSKQAMDNLARNLSAFADLKYEKIETSLQGSVTVNNLSLYSALIDDRVTIRAIKLKTDDIFSLLTLKNKINNNEIPKSLLIHIQGVEMNMDGNIAQTFTAPDTAPNIGDNLATLACGNTKRFDAQALQDMGYHSILADFIFQFNYDESRRKMDLTFIENLDRLFSAKMTTTISNISQIPSFYTSSNLPRLGIVQVSYDDDTLTDRKITYCAKQNQSTEAEYIEKHVNLFNLYLKQIGVNLGPELLSAYKETLVKPGSMDLSLDFRGINDLMELTEIPIPDLIHNLSTELSVNGNPVNVHGIKINTDKFMQAAMGKTPSVTVKDPNVEPEKPPKAFHKISKSKLDKYKDYQVIIKTYKGKTYQGRLQIVKSHHYKYAVATRTRGGEISYHVEENDIKSVQVYY